MRRCISHSVKLTGGFPAARPIRRRAQARGCGPRCRPDPPCLIERSLSPEEPTLAAFPAACSRSKRSAAQKSSRPLFHHGGYRFQDAGSHRAPADLHAWIACRIRNLRTRKRDDPRCACREPGGIGSIRSGADPAGLPRRGTAQRASARSSQAPGGNDRYRGRGPLQPVSEGARSGTRRISALRRPSVDVEMRALRSA